MSVYLSTCLSASLKTKLFCETSSSFELDNIQSAAILRDFLNVWGWQRQNQSNSARHPQFLNLTTSETKQFCDTSSFSKLTTSKNEAILRDFLQKWKVACSADGLVPMRFAIFPAHLSKSKLLRLPRKMHLWRSSSNVPHLPSFVEMLQNPHVLLTYPLRLPRKTTSEPPKVARTCGVLMCFVHFDFDMCFAPQRRVLFRHLNFQKWSGPDVLCTFWLRNALRHHGVHFFDINFQKCSRPGVLHFDFDMCFGPQQRALFRRLNFQKCSEREVLFAFSLARVLLATTACTFSTSQLPKVVRSWCVLYILTWKCASRHNGVQFVISLLARWLCTRRFSEPTFRPSRGTIHWKNSVSRLSYLFAHLHLLSSDSFSSLISSHLCFSSVHIVGSLTSKLPSIILNLKSHEIPGMPRKSAGRRLCRHVLKTNLTKEKETMWGWIILATKSSSNLSSCSILPSGNQTWLGKDTRFMWK